jgi:hypothetical protein
MSACLSNPYQPLDLIHHKLGELLDPLTSVTANTSRESPNARRPS